MRFTMSEAVSYETFLSRLALLLQVADSDLDHLPLADVRNYDSLGKIEVSALIEDCFGFIASQADLDTCKTAKDLFELASSNG